DTAQGARPQSCQPSSVLPRDRSYGFPPSCRPRVTNWSWKRTAASSPNRQRICSPQTSPQPSSSVSVRTAANAHESRRNAYNGALLFMAMRCGYPISKIVSEFVHVHKTREELLAAEEPVLIEWRGVRDANGSRGLNEDTARTKP